MKFGYRFFLWLTLAITCCSIENVYGRKVEKLCFRSDSTFKIVQFTDLHLVWKTSERAYECVDHVIQNEKPDFIILTGDIIFSRPALDNFKRIIQYISSYKTPFAFVFGNHDHQFDATDSMLLASVKDVPYNMTTTVAGIDGDSNFDLPIYSKDGRKVESVIYGLDSHDSSRLTKAGVKGYDYIQRDQIDWYIATSKKYTKENGGTPIPSIAFFHIPLQEFAVACTNQRAALFGTRSEAVCCADMNSGLFSAMKEQGDIMGIFCGHDHDNDYAVNWYNILLAYGRYSGDNTAYNHLKGNGGRVIELKEGTRTIHTWIRLTNGEMHQDTLFPKDYLR